MNDTNRREVEEKIAAYIDKHDKWREPLEKMRALLNETALEEAVKWGVPTWTLDGKIVASIAGFKQHYALWFHQGVFLTDPHGHLVSAQEGNTRGLRHWRFGEGERTPVGQMRAYIKEAIANQRAGKVIKPEKKSLAMPPDLQEALDRDAHLQEAFAALTPGRQRAYADHISEAKQEKTRQKRLATISPMILAGIGLYDKYKDC